MGAEINEIPKEGTRGDSLGHSSSEGSENTSNFTTSIDSANKPVTNQTKKFGINAIEQDLIDFQKAKDDPEGLKQFLDKFQQEYASEGVENHNDVYSLLLSSAIVFKDTEIVKYLLANDHGNMLTSLDEAGYSPITYILRSGDHDMLDATRGYIKSYIQDDPSKKVHCYDRDVANILTIMKMPRFTDLAKEEYMEIFDHLYSDITPFTELLGTFDVGESLC